MSDNISKRPPQRYAPGELEKTRKNLGTLQKEDALKMMKILGGEVGVEKSAPIDMSKIPQKSRTYTKRSNSSSNKSGGGSNSAGGGLVPDSNPLASVSVNSKAKKNNGESLPQISSKERSTIDKLMMSPDYQIKPNYGLFQFFYNLITGGAERVTEQFFNETLLAYIEHMNSFSLSVKNLAGYASAKFKEQLVEANSVQLLVIKNIINWDINSIKKIYREIQSQNNVTIQMLVPVIRLCYRCLIPIYFLGENRVTDAIKKIYVEIAEDPKALATTREAVLQYTKDASNEWLLIYGQVFKGMYPILLRICSTDFVPYPEFFYSRISRILPFLKLTKYDILMPERKGEEQTEEQEEQNEEEAIDEPEEIEEKVVARRQEEDGIKLLEMLFPLAGWESIKSFPDFYAYFQPLYQFQDGFNVLSPKNPLQVVVILIRILEDFFQGCRNIKFSLGAIPELQNSTDSLNDIFAEWSTYRDILFEKKFCGALKDYTNHLTTQSDFYKSKYGRKELTDILWQEKYDFLPNMLFDIDFVGKPYRDSTYKPLSARVAYLQTIFTYFTKAIRSCEETGIRSEIAGVSNIWDPYRFDMPNNISRRLDVLLSVKNTQTANNANLLKATNAVINVLDWIINDSGNPLIADKIAFVYRTADGGDTHTPVFSIPVRSDQNKVFLKYAKPSATALIPLLNGEHPNISSNSPVNNSNTTNDIPPLQNNK